MFFFPPSKKKKKKTNKKKKKKNNQKTPPHTHFAFGFTFFALAVIFISNLVAAFSLTEYDNELAWQSLWYAKAASCTDASIVKSWTCPGCEFHPRFQLLNVNTNSTVGDLAFTGYDPD